MRIKEPPPPNFKPLPPEANVSLARLAATLATGTGRTLTALSEDLKYKMLRAKPNDLMYTLETMSASWKEYEDPTTLDNLVKAIQVDAITELYKAVSTSGLRPISHLGELLHVAETMNSGRESAFHRVEQFFNLLDKAIDDALGLRPRPQAGVHPHRKADPDRTETITPERERWFANVSYRPQVPVSDQGVMRERLLYVTLSSYQEAGLYDQLVEFHQLALRRWGPIKDAGLEARINEFVNRARRVTAMRTWDSAQVGDTAFKIDWGRSLVINFKVNTLNSIGRFSFSVGFSGKKKPEDESEELIWVGVGSSETGAPGSDPSWFEETRGWFAMDQTRLPSGLTAPQAQGKWSALKIEYRKTQRALFFYLNGQLMGSIWSPMVRLVNGYGILTSFQINIHNNTDQSITFRVSGN